MISAVVANSGKNSRAALDAATTGSSTGDHLINITLILASQQLLLRMLQLLQV